MQYIAFYKSDAPPGPPADPKGMDELVTRQSAAGKFLMGGGFLPAEQGMRVRSVGRRLRREGRRREGNRSSGRRLRNPEGRTQRKKSCARPRSF